MKKIFTLVCMVWFVAGAFAQAPPKMSYQAVVRNSSNQVVANQTVGMQISILQGSVSGTAVYVETQAPVTSSSGLVAIVIGTGTVVSGSLATIDWANGTYFIKTETDPTGGSTYTITGTSQLLSVPYALSAGTSGKAGTADTLKSGPVGVNNLLLMSDGTGWLSKDKDGNGLTMRMASQTRIDGYVGIPAANNYRYLTPKNKSYKVGFMEMIAADPGNYHARIDDGGFNSSINGLGSMWAEGESPITNGAAFFVAPVHLPDSAVITGLSAQMINTFSSVPPIAELYRTDGSGYLNNSAQLIATVTATNSTSLVQTVSTSSISSSFKVVDNANYIYFIRYTGVQNSQNLRFISATIQYRIYRSEY
ncbi:MAG: hypothetical protein ABJA76_09175 [Mucilaginibacter sp.]